MLKNEKEIKYKITSYLAKKQGLTKHVISSKLYVKHSTECGVFTSNV